MRVTYAHEGTDVQRPDGDAHRTDNDKQDRPGGGDRESGRSGDGNDGRNDGSKEEKEAEESSGQRP